MFQHLKSPLHHQASTEVQSDTEKLSESPLLNLFLKTLQSTPPTSDKEGEESSNTEVER